MKVQTKIGLIDREDLTVQDLIEESDEDNARVTCTIWRLNGREIRRDVWVNALRFPEIGVTTGV